MTSEQWAYQERSDYLIREFAKVYDRLDGTIGSHKNPEARRLSEEIRIHARGFKPEWYRPLTG